MANAAPKRKLTKRNKFFLLLGSVAMLLSQYDDGPSGRSVLGLTLFAVLTGGIALYFDSSSEGSGP
jgi:hypothetical protein